MFLSILPERRLVAGVAADLGSLLDDIAEPPIETVGALPLDRFITKAERRALAASVNVLASPTFASWRTGATLDVGAWLTPGADGRTPAVVVSVAHLDDEGRALVDKHGGVSAVAARSGIPQPSLSRMLGSASIPRKSTLYQIANALGVLETEIAMEWTR